MATTLTHTTSGYFQGETLVDLEKLILWELGQVIGNEVSYDRFPQWLIRISYDRFPQWLIRKYLNDRQNKFVFYSQCLKKFALIRAKEDYRQYRLPVNCMENGVIAAKYYDSATSYTDLKIVDLDYMNEKQQGYLIAGSSDPEFAFQGDSYGNIPMLEVHPAPDEDGTEYTLGDDAGIYIGADLPSGSSNITGAATGGSGTTLDDTAVDFTDMGLGPGMAVRNVGDGSMGVIQTIATTRLTFAATLTGGTTNAFAAGNSYEILVGEYGVLIDWDSDEQYLYESQIGLLSTITVPAGNFRVDYIPYPLSFPSEGNDLQYPEIPKIYHVDLAMGVVANLLRTFHENSKEFKRADSYETMFNNAAGIGSMKKQSRPFQKKSVAIRPRLR